MQLRSGKYTKEDQEDSQRRPEIIQHDESCPHRKSLTRVTNSNCNYSSSSKHHHHWLIARSPKTSPGTDNSNKSSKSTSKKKERIHFFPKQEESTSSNCIHENEEDSLRRVSAYSRCLKNKPPRFVLSEDEDDYQFEDVYQIEKNDVVTPKPSGKVKGPPSVAKTTSSSTLKRALYWTKPERKEQLPKRIGRPKSDTKRRMITGINKVPLSFIAKKMKRSPQGPFYTDGVEYRRFQENLKLESADDLAVVDNESSKTLNYSKEDLLGIFPPREGELKVKVDNNILEVIGNFYEVKLEGKVLWKASNEESNT
ncbi:hypothetical protein ACQ4LE_011123 [Meloidogyne hapla]